MKRSPRVSAAGASSRSRTSAPRAGRDLRSPRRPAIDTRPSTSRCLVKAHARAVLERLAAAAVEHRVDPPRHGQRCRARQRLAARDVADLDAAEVDRGALAGDRLGAPRAVHLHAAHLHRAVARQQRQLVVQRDAARTPACRSRPCRSPASRTRDRSAAAPAPSTGRAPTCAACAASAARSASSPSPVRADTATPARARGTIPRPARAPPAAPARASRRRPGRFGQHDDAARNAQQPADVEVLARLRHHRFVGRDDQQHAVDAADAGEHGPHEPLVARHVDERDASRRRSRRARSPSSIVMPRSFSSFSRSGSMPVSACTSALLP